MSSRPRIAVLMTCHNRRDTTLSCLHSLRGQTPFREDDLYLVDDGSKDGTGEAVRRLMPRAHVIAGDGTLFWNGGTNRAWAAAIEAPTEYDWYLWLNDDVVLDSGALDRLLADAVMCAGPREPLVMAGATMSADRESVTYGAHVRPDPARPLRLTLLEPDRVPQMAITISGNAVLVSRVACERLGRLDPGFAHIYGDLDYGLRAEEAGIPVMLAGEPVGVCEANPDAGTWRDPAAPRAVRVSRRFAMRKSLHARDWNRLVARHDPGPLARLRHLLGPYARILFGDRQPPAGPRGPARLASPARPR